MESILESIAEEPVTPSAKRRAYQLILKIARNIIQAASRDDPNLEKYKWVKAQNGSALRENVISVSPLFRKLLEALGFTFRVGRPPHVRTGDPQEYVVFRDDANVEDLASKAQILEAVLESISEEESSSTKRDHPSIQPPSAGEVSRSESSEPTASSATACSVDPRPSGSATQRLSGQDTALLELRREQQERYRQRGAGGGSTASRSNETSSSARGESGGGWFWQKFGWGGSNDSNSDDSNSQGRSTSSRRPPLNNRMMTLRDLPKPQRRG